MTKLTLWIGGLLVATGVIAYIVTAAASVTALIPAFVGILLVAAALIARNPNMHRHAIHAALAIALLAALGSLSRVVKLGEVFDGTSEVPAAIIVSTIMFVLLVIYVVAGVRSFIAARRAREGSSGTAA